MKLKGTDIKLYIKPSRRNTLSAVSPRADIHHELCCRVAVLCQCVISYHILQLVFKLMSGQEMAI